MNVYLGRPTSARLHSTYFPTGGVGGEGEYHYSSMQMTVCIQSCSSSLAMCAPSITAAKVRVQPTAYPIKGRVIAMITSICIVLCIAYAYTVSPYTVEDT